jgi:hypothetical protein
VITIAVDFDETITTRPFPEMGNPNHYICNWLRSLDKNEVNIIIHTCRVNEEFGGPNNKYVHEMQEFLKRFNIPYNSIWIGLGKPVAYLYIDDRALPAKFRAYSKILKLHLIPRIGI